MSLRAVSTESAGLENLINGLLPGFKRQYDRAINRELSRQQWQNLFQRNITTVLQEGYQQVLQQMQALQFSRERESSNTLQIDIDKLILSPFRQVIDELLQYALHKHRSSCAMSNFPEEHNPSQAYIGRVLEVIEQEWSVFAAQVTALLRPVDVI